MVKDVAEAVSDIHGILSLFAKAEQESILGRVAADLGLAPVDITDDDPYGGWRPSDVFEVVHEWPDSAADAPHLVVVPSQQALPGLGVVPVVKPAKMPNGEWGVRGVPGLPSGSVVIVCTKSGKRWQQCILYEIERLPGLYATTSVPKGTPYDESTNVVLGATPDDEGAP